MGKAGMPYARSVQQMHPIPRNTLPDAGLVFDTLLRREKVRHILPLAFILIGETVLVCQAPRWTVQHDVLVCCAPRSHVSFIATI